MLPCLDDNIYRFPETSSALKEPNGLLAFGGDLESSRLLEAYRHGIFPWYEEDQPILWWSPDPRMVLFPENLHISRSLQKALKQNEYIITFNRQFHKVIDACSAPRIYADGTWITPEMKKAFSRLHESGYAISVETSDRNGELVGGLYGIALGKVFFGESMFSTANNASKIAFVHLVRLLASLNYALIDCQVSSHFLASFGAEVIPRARFESFLPDPGPLPQPDTRWFDLHR